MREIKNSGSQPLVSIVTPVYNNAEYIAECIESVLAQHYQNWDYTVVDNCSTDGSGEIACRYAAKEPRMRVLRNSQFLKVISNHNHALRQISPKSKYCKVVFADDWIFPQCVAEMVAVAEEQPSVGIVGAYGLWEVIAEGRREHAVVWDGLPYPSAVVPGRDICRRFFLEGTYFFGTPTSLLYRSDLIRSRDALYNEANLHADKEAGVELLKISDFGFVHQVLTFTRSRQGSLNKMAVDVHIDIGCHLQNLLSHGQEFLSLPEFESCLERHLVEYYNFLAVSLIRRPRDNKFWAIHRQKLNDTVGFSRSRLAGAILRRLCRAALNPYETMEKLQEGRNHRKTSAGAQVDSVKQSITPPSMENGANAPVRS